MIFKPRKLLEFTALFLAVLILSSCSSVKEKTKANPAEDEAEVVEEQKPSAETEAREPIFVYGAQTRKDTMKEVTLKLNAEPLLLASGYVRLVGVVSGPARHAEQGDAGGGRPMALVEVGGKGLCVEVGEEIGNYRIVGISEKGICLIKKKEG